MEEWLKEVCGSLSRNIYVFSQQSLSAMLLGRPHPVSHGSREEKTRYFWHTLPQALWARVNQTESRPLFDVRIVDEAQDHNIPSGTEQGSGSGWGSVYLGLLRGGGIRG
jgi:hypothetical protein